MTNFSLVAIKLHLVVEFPEVFEFSLEVPSIKEDPIIVINRHLFEQLKFNRDFASNDEIQALIDSGHLRLSEVQEDFKISPKTIELLSSLKIFNAEAERLKTEYINGSANRPLSGEGFHRFVLAHEKLKLLKALHY